MDVQKQQEEKFREACCFGDIDAVVTLISRGVNVNSQHDINGWTALHWACKRGYVEIAQLLMKNGAQTDIENSQSQKPANLTSNPQILQLLGVEMPAAGEGAPGKGDSLPITPNYLTNPPLDYKVQVNSSTAKSPFGNSQPNGIESMDTYIASQMGKSTSSSVASMEDTVTRDTKELILKVRLADSDDPDFIEIDLQKPQMNYSYLLTSCCKEMAVNPQMVERIRKLPNTRLRNDRDAQRLTDYAELELVMKGHGRLSLTGGDTHSTSKNSYRSISGFKNQTILY